MADAGLTEAALATIALENCGREAALWALSVRLSSAGVPVAVIAGRGAAGAAALTAARHLANWDLAPTVHILGMRERLGPEAEAAMGLLERFDVRARELLNSAQAGEVIDALPAGAPLVYGAAGDEKSWRSTELADLVNRRGAARGPAGLAAAFSVRARTARPAPGAPLVRVEAERYNREAVRLLDSTAIREYGVPSLALMENAGYWAARELWSRLEDPAKARVAVLCGRGNNGGDGFVLARHLAWWGVGSVGVFLAGAASSLIDDARVNYEYLGAPGVAVTELESADAAAAAAKEISAHDWLVDALLGTGLAGPVRGMSAEVLSVAAGARRPVMAVDTPSGLDATDGFTRGAALPAKVTVSFGVPKVGFFQAQGPRLVGELVVSEISLPRKITGAKVRFDLPGDLKTV